MHRLIHCQFGIIRYKWGSIVSVSRIVVHGSYSYSTLDSDIGVPVLSSDLTLGQQQAKAATLPTSGSDPASGTAVTAAGWGLTSVGGSTLPSNLYKHDGHIVARSSCQTSYGGVMAVTNNMVCV